MPKVNETAISLTEWVGFDLRPVIAFNHQVFRLCCCWVVVALMVCSYAMEASGQSSSQGAVLGTITDPNRNALPGVDISIVNNETGVKRSGQSNTEGHYRVDFLAPGNYRIVAERIGFKQEVIEKVTLQVGQAARVDIQLVLGEITEQVTVTSSAAPIDTESATLATVINNDQILKLPLNGREFLALAALVPGAESGNPKRGAVYSKGISVGFNGARAGYNSYYLDGASSTSPNRNELISSPALEAIKEFRVETNMYSAQYGRSGGAVINIVTSSGTNAYHGTIYEYHRNKALDARPHFYTGSRENQPQYLLNQFGIAGGGPVIKNKTFFFGSFEGYRQKLPGQAITTFAPTDKERIGDFSESINPWTLRPVVLTNPFTGQVIPGNKLPPELINPVGKKLMDLWPKPNFNDPFLNLRYFRSGTFTQNKFLLKGDHTFSQRDSLSASFNFGNYASTQVGNTENGDISDLSQDRALVVTYTHVFSPTMVNDLKGSYTYYRSGGDFTLNDKNYAKEWGLWSGTNADIKGAPRLVMYGSGFTAFTLGNAGPFKYVNRNLYFKDNLAWTSKKHTLFIGGEFIRQPYDWEFNNIPATYLIGLLDGDPASDDVWKVSGSTFADLLMGLSALTYHNVGDGQPMKLKRNAFGVYVQDDWKVTPRLTLNLGLRYDYEAPFASTNNQFVTLNFDTGRPWYAAGAPADRLAPLRFKYDTGGPNRPFEPSKKNFSPRVGLAFRPFNDNRTVIRAGYGVFYTSETAWSTVFGSWVNPFAGEFRYFSRGFIWPDGRDRFVTFDKEPLDFRFAASSDSGLSYTTTPEFPTGYLQQYNVSIARDIGAGVALEAAYVGTKGTNLDGIMSLSGYSLAAYQKAIANGVNPGLRAKGHNSKYNSLQLKATKRLSNGLDFLAAFTWGHAMAESSNSDVNENTLYDLAGTSNPTKRRYSNADFDVRKRFTLSGTYELPLGHNKKFGSGWHPVVDGVLGGWSLNYIFTMQDGFPFSVFDPAQRFPNRICDGNLPSDQRTPDRWFDIKCFPTKTPETVTLPDGNTLTVLNGNASPNVITGPGLKNLDLGIHKSIGITEGKRLEIRFEAFNALNHPNYLAPALNIFFATESGAKLTRVRDMRDIQVAIKFSF